MSVGFFSGALLHQTAMSTAGFTYDYRGRRITATDQNGKTTTYAYDDADRLTSVTDDHVQLRRLRPRHADHVPLEPVGDLRLG